MVPLTDAISCKATRDPSHESQTSIVNGGSKTVIRNMKGNIIIRYTRQTQREELTTLDVETRPSEQVSNQPPRASCRLDGLS